MTKLLAKLTFHVVVSCFYYCFFNVYLRIASGLAFLALALTGLSSWLRLVVICGTRRKDSWANSVVSTTLRGLHHGYSLVYHQPIDANKLAILELCPRTRAVQGILLRLLPLIVIHPLLLGVQQLGAVSCQLCFRYCSFCHY